MFQYLQLLESPFIQRVRLALIENIFGQVKFSQSKHLAAVREYKADQYGIILNVFSWKHDPRQNKNENTKLRRWKRDNTLLYDDDDDDDAIYRPVLIIVLCLYFRIFIIVHHCFQYRFVAFLKTYCRVPLCMCRLKNA